MTIISDFGKPQNESEREEELKHFNSPLFVLASNETDENDDFIDEWYYIENRNGTSSWTQLIDNASTFTLKEALYRKMLMSINRKHQLYFGDANSYLKDIYIIDYSLAAADEMDLNLNYVI